MPVTSLTAAAPWNLLLVLNLLPLAYAGALEGLRTLPASTTRANYELTYYVEDVPNARSLALSDHGPEVVVFVSTRRLTKVYATVDRDQDGKVDDKHEVVSDLATPNGIAYADNSLFVAQVDKVWRFDDVNEAALGGTPFGDGTLISAAFPSDASHGWKFIRFDPTKTWLYVPVGAPCNICTLDNHNSITYGSINRMRRDGSQLQTVATGVRNTVGFDFSTQKDGELFFTDNGRDHMGDDLPDCTLNVVRVHEGATLPGAFGYPYCHGAGNGDPYVRDAGLAPPLSDPSLNSGGTVVACGSPGAGGGPASATENGRVQALGPHTAPLGMRFYNRTFAAGGASALPEADFPDNAEETTVIVALHGSWNRSRKIGYSVHRVILRANGEVKTHDVLIDGWLDRAADSAWGRPVDVEQLPDGSILISDDGAGVVYRLAYRGKSPASTTTTLPPSPPPATTTTTTTTAAAEPAAIPAPPPPSMYVDENGNPLPPFVDVSSTTTLPPSPPPATTTTTTTTAAAEPVAIPAPPPPSLYVDENGDPLPPFVDVSSTTTTSAPTPPTTTTAAAPAAEPAAIPAPPPPRRELLPSTTTAVEATQLQPSTTGGSYYFSGPDLNRTSSAEAPVAVALVGLGAAALAIAP